MDSLGANFFRTFRFGWELDERQLFAKTLGLVSLKIWRVARKWRTRLPFEFSNENPKVIEYYVTDIRSINTTLSRNIIEYAISTAQCQIFRSLGEETQRDIQQGQLLSRYLEFWYRRQRRELPPHTFLMTSPWRSRLVDAPWPGFVAIKALHSTSEGSHIY